MEHLRILFTALLLMCSTVASAYDFEVGGIYYNITDVVNRTVEVTYKYDWEEEGENDYEGDVTIPETVNYRGTIYSVTYIGSGAFSDCTGLTSVVIGNSVTSIGERAFSGCSSLDCVVLGKNVASVGETAFRDCVNVTRILSKAKTPPTCGTQALDDINKCECILSVPNEAKSKYQAASQWRDFFFIEDLQHP